MKTRFLALAALVLGLASCQTEPEGLDVNVGGEEVNTVLTVTIPETETRTGGANSAIGAFGNVDFSKYDVRFILEVYNMEGQLINELAKERLVNTEDDAKSTAFDLRLIPGRDYRFVVWADIVAQGSEADLHYNTTNLKEVKIATTEWNLTDETRDAYTNIYDVEDFTTASNINIELKRPLGKLRVVTTDIKDMFNVLPEDIKVEYTSDIYTSFNAFESDVIKSAKVSNLTKTIKISENKYANEWDAATGKSKGTMTLFTDYYFAAKDQEPINFTLDVKDNNGDAIPQVQFNTPIPVQRNYLTTVTGPILTDAANINVYINDAFDGYHEIDADIKDQLEEATKYKNYVIDLKGDLIWETGAGIGSTPLIPEGAETETLTINGNGYKVIATGDGVGQIRMANGGKLIINNAVIEDKSVSYAENSWEYGYLEFGGKLEFNECQFVNAVMMSGEEATFNKCSFNSGKDNEYAVWVDNGKAYFNECTIEGPRGIKTHEAYGSEVVEIVVDKCQFKNISVKPGMAIGTVNAATKIEIKNSTFTNCQPGDQGLFMYETDTNVATFDFSQTNNTVNAPVTTQESLEKLLKSDLKEINVTLEADAPINVQDAYIKLGGANTERIVIDGKKLASASATGAAKGNHKLTLATTYWSRLNTVNPDAVLVLKNLALTSSQETGTWNSYDVTFQCNVELENVELLKAVAFDGAGKSVKVKNVTIKESHDYYAMWIAAAGQTVDVENLVIESAGRGIKIDDQYVNDAVAKVTLNIDGLKVKSQNKAAIMVKSTKGADINIKNIDITEVAADTKNAVWVDEDAADYAALVNVTGASMFTEGAEIIEGNDKLDETTIENNSVVYLGEGEYVIPAAAKGKTVKFVGTGDPEDTKVAVTKVGTTGENCDYGLDGSNATFENITITTNSSTYIGYARCNGTYKNCIINGTYTLYGDSVFEDCTFNVSGDVYNIWTWGAPTATFTRCTFNCDGKAMLLYGTANTKLTMNNCVFNDNGSISGKAAIETGNDYGKSYELTVNNATVNGFDINPNGIVTGTTLWANKNSMSAGQLKVIIDGYTWVADGLSKKDGEYYVSNANGLATLNAMMSDKTAGKDTVVNLNANIDFVGKTWTPVDSHADTAFSFKELNGNGHTIYNLTINGQAMFKRFAGFGDVTVKDITFDKATVSSTTINSSILTGQTYQNVLLDNVDVKNSTINGGYKVAPLIATVYNESSSTITATLKNCDVENVTVKATSYDFCTTGMVAFVYADDNDTIEFENCTVKNVKLIAPNDSYKAHAAIYTTDSESLYNEAEGVTVTNVTFEAL